VKRLDATFLPSQQREIELMIIKRSLDPRKPSDAICKARGATSNILETFSFFFGDTKAAVREHRMSPPEFGLRLLLWLPRIARRSFEGVVHRVLRRPSIVLPARHSDRYRTLGVERVTSRDGAGSSVSSAIEIHL
jgi:hypothetical protein